MNYPSEEQIEEFAKSYSDPVFVTHVCQAFMDVVQKINPDPVKPEFPKWVEYVTWDKKDYWYLWEVIPFCIEKEFWNTTDGRREPCNNTNQILWLEHINAGRPPEDSLIKLGDYKC